MAVIWGLDLRELQWGKFKGSYMFNNVYHLRRAKMIVYQIAMTLCICAESLGTAALTDYVDQQSFIEHLDHLAAVYNDDYVGIAAYNIFVGIVVATIFGAAFFFDLFWPERHESKAVRLAWKISAVVATIMALGDVLAFTEIVARRHAYITGVDAKLALYLLRKSHRKPHLIYSHNPKAVAAVVLLWLAFPFIVASTCILFLSHQHDDIYGPKASRTRKEEEIGVGGSSIGLARLTPQQTPILPPSPIPKSLRTESDDAHRYERVDL